MDRFGGPQHRHADASRAGRRAGGPDQRLERLPRHGKHQGALQRRARRKPVGSADAHVRPPGRWDVSLRLQHRSEHGWPAAIDGQLFGDYASGGNHNFHFTFELHGSFIYDAGVGQIFEFNGDDDVWVFINGRIVVDLGGRHSPKSMFVDMDRLGLTDGEAYSFAFFLMERRTAGSHCKITTNLPLETANQVSVSSSFD